MKLVQRYQASREFEPDLERIVSNVMLDLKSPDRAERESCIRYLQRIAIRDIVDAVGHELAWQACSLDIDISRKARALIRLIGPDLLDRFECDEDDPDE